MIEQITTIGSAIIAAAGIVSTVVQTVRAGKKKNVVKLAKIVQELPQLINEAEEALGEGTGAAKLQYVLNKCHIKCLQSNIEFDEQGITAEIENILSTPQKGESTNGEKN